MRITVGVPTYNNAATIGRVLDAVANQSRVPDEILVVDDGSRDGSGAEAMGRKGSRRNKFPECAPGFGSDSVVAIEQNRRRSQSYAKDFAIEQGPKTARRRDAKMGSYFCASPKVRVLTHNRNLGLAQARNTIVENAKGDVIVFFDADAVPRPDCVDNLLKHFSDKKVAAVGGRGVEGAGTRPIQKWRARITPQDHGTKVILDDWMLMGLCCAFRKKALLAVGGFDANFQRAGEDVDICLRLRKCGYHLVYEPLAVVEHFPGGSLLSVTMQAMRHAMYATYALTKNGNGKRDYVLDTCRHLSASALDDLRAGKIGDSLYGVLNMAARTVGMAAGTLKAKGDLVRRSNS